MKKTFNFFEKKRRALTGVFIVTALCSVFLTEHSWEYGGAVQRAFRWTGALLVIMGVAGRLWSTMYIGGRKNDELVQGGPYSMCRNPLYLFSFIAGLGVTLSFENVLLAAIYIIGFSLYYPFVIRSEERRLEMLFGETFRAYMKSTPRFAPNPFLFRFGRPEVSAARLWRTFQDAIMFIIMVPAAYLIDWLKEGGILHQIVRWRIP